MARVGMGIDLGSESMKIVQGRFKGETFQVLRARTIRLPAGGERMAAVRRVLESEGVKGSGLLGLTGKDIIIRYTHVPPVTSQRLKTLMDFEVGEIVAQSGGDVVADYALLPIDEGPEEEDIVLLGLVKDEFLAERMDVLKAAGIRVEGACPNAIALFNCFLKNGEFRSEEVTLLLNIGAENCDIALQKNAQLVFARNQALGGATFTRAIMDGLGVDEARAEKLKRLRADLSALLPGQRADQDAERLARTLVGPAGRLFSTVQSTLTFAKNQSKIYNLSLGRVLLTGGGARLKGLDAYLAQNLGVPVEHFDPLVAADLSALSPEEARDANGAGQELAVAVGLAQMAVDARFFRITLLPEKVRKMAAFMRSTAFMIAAGVLLALFMAFSFLEAKTENDLATGWSSKVSRERVKRQKDLRTYQDLQAGNARLREKVNLLAERRNLGPSLVKAVRAVDKHLPAEFWIKDLKLSSEPYRALGGPSAAAGKHSLLGGRRGGKVEAPQGPPIPTVIVTGAGSQTGRKLVPILNAFVAGLQEEPEVFKVERKSDLGAGKLEFTLHLYLAEPPGLAKESDGAKDSDGAKEKKAR